ncbi:MAG: glutamate--cysteine ligase [Burkholderiales bacterium]|nr:glutamate--cysteine ligase [Burkholderiales bacterium]
MGPFAATKALTIGVELELQLVNLRDYDLTRGAASLISALAGGPHAKAVKPEITESMIELNSAVHATHAALLADLDRIRAGVCAAAAKLNIGVAGGGAHPFHHWAERRIFPTERFHALSDLYGYLAKQFTVFGQHIHIGCVSGDAAIRLIQQLARYVPQFIALAAASPFSQGEDTAYASSRLHAVSAFPLSGRMPAVDSWAEFERYFARMASFGIVRSMKDFYWDIRPKPEYGTIEIRVCDTPLDLDTAAAMAAFAQALCAWLSEQDAGPSLSDDFDLYEYNRFQACRFGFDADIVDAGTKKLVPLREQIVATLDAVLPHAQRLEAVDPLALLYSRATAASNGARWMRESMRRHGTLADVVRAMCERWCTPRSVSREP